MLTRATHLLLSEKRLYSIQSLERPGGKLFIVNCKIRIFLYLCVCMLKYVHRGGYLCKSMYMCMETILETGSLTGIWGPPPKLGQFTRKLLGSTCLCITNTGITSAHPHTMASGNGTHVYLTGTLPIGPSYQPPEIHTLMGIAPAENYSYKLITISFPVTG